MRVQCQRGHFIADVDIADDGMIIPRGTRHGLVWDYAPTLNITRVHARCFSRKCAVDVSIDYRDLCAELAAAAARGDTKHRLVAQ